MIYLFENPGQISEELLARLLQVLPPHRKEKALAYRYAIDQKLSATAWLLLILALRKEYGIQEHPVLSYGKRDKPRLAAYPHIHFNISHCKRAVACAVSDRKVGIDTECVEPFDLLLAERICKESELKAILASDRPDIAFTTLWTAKESVMKFTGEGLRDDVREILTDTDLSLHTRIGESRDGLYALTVAYPSNVNTGCQVAYLTLSDLVNLVDDPLQYHAEI